MPEDKPQNRRELEGSIIRKAWSDPAYHEKLMADPKAILEQELATIYPDILLPDELQVQAVQETPNAITLVVPAPPEELELKAMTEEDLVSLSEGTAVNLNVNANVNVNVNANINVNVNVNANVSAGEEPPR